MTTSVPYYMHV